MLLGVRATSAPLSGLDALRQLQRACSSAVVILYLSADAPLQFGKAASEGTSKVQMPTIPNNNALVSKERKHETRRDESPNSDSMTEPTPRRRILGIALPCSNPKAKRALVQQIFGTEKTLTACYCEHSRGEDRE